MFRLIGHLQTKSMKRTQTKLTVITHRQFETMQHMSTVQRHYKIDDERIDGVLHEPFDHSMHGLVDFGYSGHHTLSILPVILPLWRGRSSLSLMYSWWASKPISSHQSRKKNLSCGINQE